MMKCPNCNEIEHEPNARFCHVCGQILDPERADFSQKLLEQGQKIQETWKRLQLQQETEGNSSEVKWIKVLRYFLLLVILIEYVFISVYESSITDADGVLGYAGTTIFANIFIFICTLFLCSQANMGYFKDQKPRWRFYFEWLHFFTSAQMPILGFYILSNMQNGWTLLLNGILVGVVFLADLWLPDLID